MVETYEVELMRICRQMRLSRNLAERALVIEADSHQEFLTRLFTEELSYRDARRYDALVKNAGFYNIKTLEGFVTDDIQFPVGAGLKELESLEFLSDKTNICMYGGTGTGKTLLSTALGVLACRRGVSVRFYRTAALVNGLSEAKAAGTLSRLLGKIDKADL